MMKFLIIKIITIFVLTVNCSNGENIILDLRTSGLATAISETEVFFIMKEIILNTVYKSRPNYKKYKALVDDEDFERVNKLKWHTQILPNTIYAATRLKGNSKIYLHTFLTGFTITDHKNGDGLDNQRHNLREATKSQNNTNKRKTIKTAKIQSKYRGVHWQIHRNKWNAEIACNGKKYYLGTFDSEDEAGLAYNERAKELHGEFAWLNKVQA